MKFPEVAFRSALQTRLEATGYPVYSSAPQEISGVYVIHRDTQYLEHGTKGQVGWDASVMIDVWDARPDSASPRGVSDAMDAIMQGLTCSHDPVSGQNFLTISGYTVVRQDVSMLQNLTVPGDMPHAVLQMTFWITED